MTDNELLLALSNLFDKKLQPIKEDISELKDQMESLEDRMTSLENRMDSLECRMDSLETRMDSLEDNFKIIDLRTKKLELQMENQVLPRLQTIESCYTSTYDRYKSGVTHIEALQEDVTILKTVVAEHSQKLQKIS